MIRHSEGDWTWLSMRKTVYYVLEMIPRTCFASDSDESSEIPVSQNIGFFYRTDCVSYHDILPDETTTAFVDLSCK